MSAPRWTREQASAIAATDHALLEANAGAGKTTTVVGKILWHLGLPVGVDETGAEIPLCPPEHRVTLDQVAAITFTEKAAYDLARKLREEIRRLAPALLWEIDRASIGTIHSFAGGILKEHALRFGVDPGFHVLDDRETRLELNAVARDAILEAAEDDEPFAELLLKAYRLDGLGEYGAGLVGLVTDMARDIRWHDARYRSWMAGEGVDWKTLADRAGVDATDANDKVTADLCDGLVTLGRRVVERWTAHLTAENLKDFDAMVLDCRDGLRDPAAAPALASIRRRYRLLIIDEFQDTDSAQRDIAFSIAGLPEPGDGSGGPQLFLVGDPKQSIYGFRGADISVWNEVAQVVGQRLSLTRNYRSVPGVIDYVNRAAGQVVTAVGTAVQDLLMAEEPSSRVAWAPLEAGRGPGSAPAVEWLAAADGKAEERRHNEAELVATRIRDLVFDRAKGDTDGITVPDHSGELQELQYRDVAILFRSGTGVEAYTEALAKWGVPYYLAGNLGLSQQLELEDLLNLFRLIANPIDDLSAFAWLRSPFVGLRDEILARIRLGAPYRSLLAAARDFLDAGDWFEAPEHADVASLEKQALAAGLELIADLEKLRSRVPLDQLALLALERSGYSLHLQLLDQPLPRIANLQRFVRMLEQYRGHTIGAFLELWDAWKDEDVGPPQAPLYSKKDNVVTLSTVHAAKGLEWPVVFLVDLGEIRERLANSVWSDRWLGPVLAPKQADRGARADKLCGRRKAEEEAEEARVFYVAATRARDRLVIAGPTAPAKGRGEWAWRGVTGEVPVVDSIPDVEPLPIPPAPALEWIDVVAPGSGVPALVAPLRGGSLQLTRSATELMARARSRKDHRLRYVHGVLPVWRFARSAGSGSGSGSDRDGATLRADLKGTLVHGVLERIQDEDEVAELLEVVVGAVDAEEVSELLERNQALRASIEDEIRRVVASPEWKWYVEGEHWRELGFVQFRSPRRWRVGAMDLYRPGAPGVVVDFKTQDVTAGALVSEGKKYHLQGVFYRSVMAGLADRTAEVRLHFTGPGVVVPLG
ncbi:MAG: UvrD-helicase domain-containing protein [Gemmatimonadales bacterium]